jgi:succinyl-CoA synthetase beta subunit
MRRYSALPPSFFSHVFEGGVLMNELEDDLRKWVLQKLRVGVTVEQISLALAAQKVELMQADQYLNAIKDNERRP